MGPHALPSGPCRAIDHEEHCVPRKMPAMHPDVIQPRMRSCVGPNMRSYSSPFTMSNESTAKPSLRRKALTPPPPENNSRKKTCLLILAPWSAFRICFLSTLIGSSIKGLETRAFSDAGLPEVAGPSVRGIPPRGGRIPFCRTEQLPLAFCATRSGRGFALHNDGGLHRIATGLAS